MAHKPDWGKPVQPGEKSTDNAYGRLVRPCVCGKREADRIAGSVAEKDSLRVTQREQP